MIKAPCIQPDTHRDYSKDSVDHSCSYGGVDGLSHTGSFEYSCRVVKYLKDIEDVVTDKFKTDIS